MKSISFILMLLLFFSAYSLQDGINEDQQQPPPHRLLNTPYWQKIKHLFTLAQSYFFPPNLDFRGSISTDEATVNGDSGIESGTGDKVKEAVAKSLGKGKATVEESAKSAAQKLKDTLSPDHEAQEL